MMGGVAGSTPAGVGRRDPRAPRGAAGRRPAPPGTSAPCTTRGPPAEGIPSRRSLASVGRWVRYAARRTVGEWISRSRPKPDSGNW